MSRGLNKCQLIGYVGQDPESRTTQGGASVSTFSLATTREWRNEVGQKQERTEWHRCVTWSGLADVVSKYVTKGMRLYVEGAVEYRSYVPQGSEEKRYVTEINVKELIMLSNNRDVRGQVAASSDDDEDPTDFNYGANAPDDEGDLSDGEPEPPKAKRGGRKTARSR